MLPPTVASVDCRPWTPCLEQKLVHCPLRPSRCQTDFSSREVPYAVGLGKH